MAKCNGYVRTFYYSKYFRYQRTGCFSKLHLKYEMKFSRRNVHIYIMAIQRFPIGILKGKRKGLIRTAQVLATNFVMEEFFQIKEFYNIRN